MEIQGLNEDSRILKLRFKQFSLMQLYLRYWFLKMEWFTLNKFFKMSSKSKNSIHTYLGMLRWTELKLHILGGKYPSFIRNIHIAQSISSLKYSFHHTTFLRITIKHSRYYSLIWLDRMKIIFRCITYEISIRFKYN